MLSHIILYFYFFTFRTKVDCALCSFDHLHLHTEISRITLQTSLSSNCPIAWTDPSMLRRLLPQIQTPFLYANLIQAPKQQRLPLPFRFYCQKPSSSLSSLFEKLPSNMFIVAITGGIATGKSTVTKVFKEEGVPVVDADLIAREGKAKHSLVCLVVIGLVYQSIKSIISGTSLTFDPKHSTRSRGAR